MSLRDKTNALTAEEANAIFDTLVAHAGATDDAVNRAAFIHQQTQNYMPEYRLTWAALGWGGKFRRNSGMRADKTWGEIWYVDGYTEDIQPFPERQTMIDATNAALTALNAHYR